VHHGGAGTTAAGMRAGVPTLILWLWLDQPIWAAAVSQLEVGVGRPFSATTQESLAADLRLILSAQSVTRAREVATQMSKPGQSIASAADLLEDAARLGRLG
ncbi:MAG: glycosyltransferase, partial [Mycobacteriaceae bacterium]